MKFKNKLVSLLKKVHKTINEEAGKKTSAELEKKEDVLEQEQVADAIKEDLGPGDIKIADDVLSITASQAALEVPGVVGMSGGLSDDVAKLMGKEKAAKGVRITSEGRMLNITVYLEVEYGANIPELALNVQAYVKRNIQDLTGYEVQHVDVHIENVVKTDGEQLNLLEEEKDEHNR